MTLGVLLFAVFALFSIGLHEFGHFATARWFGIKIERFFIGFGPKLWSVRRGETEYGIGALPLGGYVRIAGMNPLEEVPEEDRSRTFKAKPAWQRGIVLAAGSVTHLLLAFLIVGAVLATTAEPDPGHPTLRIADVSPTFGAAPSPAAAAGVRVGDVVVSIDGVAVRTWDGAVKLIHARPGRRVEIVVRRDGTSVILYATLAPKRPDGTRAGFLGVSPGFREIHRSVPQAFREAGWRVALGMRDSLVAFKRVFSPSTIRRLFSVAAGSQPRRIDDPATLVGVGKGAGDLARHGDWVGLFFLLAGFNIFIGVANLLPLPPLDGGHLAVLGYEKLRRREVDIRKLMPVTALVVSIFATLFVLLLYLDIVRPIPNLPG
ncbi:MAG: site-2 protease family protein [Acidobacteria bacterium]|nr:site-2 protease family protein [Acidobacteriota bacterium]